MHKVLLSVAILSSLAGATVAPAVATARLRAPARAPLPRLSETAVRLLAAHNRERALAGVPPLAWDPLLAASAASYGPTLAGLGRLQHSPRAGRPTQSENLWMGPRGHYSPEQMVGSWASERGDFRPGIFPNVSRTGNWLDVSHYTQMIWRTTTHVGCAVHSDRRWDFLICRYSPKGNRDGQRVP
jgi:hypothetical protein